MPVNLIAVLRDEVAHLKADNDALRNELDWCEQDLRHALERIRELNEQLERVKWKVIG